MIKVSVIVPMYNSEKSILRCLNSIFSQDTNENIEIIVTNDGSTDSSKLLVEDFKCTAGNIKLTLVNQENSGVSKARNSGLKIAKGEYIAFLDSDDEWLPKKMSTQLAILESNNQIDFLASAFDQIKFDNKPESSLIPISVKMLAFKNRFQPSTVIMKRGILDSTGFFDETRKYAEEGEYFMRIANNHRCYFLNENLINYGDGKRGFGISGLSGNLVEMQKGETINLRLAYERGYLSSFDYCFAVAFSKMKYIRRILLTRIKK